MNETAVWVGMRGPIGAPELAVSAVIIALLLMSDRVVSRIVKNYIKNSSNKKKDE
ncbi:MAG: hypothetical protein O3A87_05740 [Verrucomicrobia bacterium]|nr:hypothetical protein [Verrucomicrobiota bacterium]MDA1005970.1 hypothetical protein [Verrucomicrobiota bacterium]